MRVESNMSFTEIYDKCRNLHSGLKVNVTGNKGEVVVNGLSIFNTEGPNTIDILTTYLNGIWIGFKMNEKWQK